MLCPLSALALAPIYFDIGALIRWLAVYIVGFIVVTIAAVRAKRGSFKIALCVAAICYLPAPFIWIGVTGAIRASEQEAERLKREADFNRSRDRGRESLIRFCAGREGMPVCQQLGVGGGS